MMTASSMVPRYTRNEEIASSVSHGVGIVLSIAGLSVLVTLAAIYAETRAVVGGAIFGTCLILTYTASTLYHAIPRTGAKRVLRVLDHAAIYLLIAGTYTPLTLISLQGWIGWTLLGVIWGLAVLGIMVTAVAMQRCKVLSMVLYLAMGWLVVIVARPLVAALSTSGIWLVLSGGLFYTLGLIFYGWKRLPFHHLVWHLFVLAGSLLHFFAVLGETMR